MSKITIIPIENTVIIDGKIETIVYAGPDNIHVIHWDDIALIGEVEYTDKGNESIDDFAPYQHFIADYTNSKVAREQTVIDKAAVDEAALTPQQRRVREYPSTSNNLYALYLARQGDTTAIDAIDAEYIVVDTKYPL